MERTQLFFPPSPKVQVSIDPYIGSIEWLDALPCAQSDFGGTSYHRQQLIGGLGIVSAESAAEKSTVNKMI